MLLQGLEFELRLFARPVLYFGVTQAVVEFLCFLVKFRGSDEVPQLDLSTGREYG